MNEPLLRQLLETRHAPAAERIARLAADHGDAWPARVWELVRAGAIPSWQKQPDLGDLIDSGFAEPDEDAVDTVDEPLLEVIVEALRRDPRAATGADVAALFRRTPWKDFALEHRAVLPGWPAWAHELALVTLGRDRDARAVLEARAPAIVQRGVSLAAIELGQGGDDDDPREALRDVVRAALAEREPDAFAIGARLGFSDEEIVAAAAACAGERDRGWFELAPFLLRASLAPARALVLACAAGPRPSCDAAPLAQAALTTDEWLTVAALRLDAPREGAQAVAELCAIAALMRAPSDAGLPETLDPLLAYDATVYPRQLYVPRLARLGGERLRALLERPFALERRGVAYVIAALRSFGPLDEELAPALRTWAREMLTRGYSLQDKAATLAEAGAAIVPFLDELRSATRDNLERRALELGALGALFCGHLDGVPVPESEDARLLYSAELARSAGAGPHYHRLWSTLPRERLDLILDIVEEAATPSLEAALADAPALLPLFRERAARRAR